MSSATLAGAILSMTSLAVSGAAQAQPVDPSSCWDRGEVDAARFHNFRIMMLVGAIHCRMRYPDALDSYNSFMRSNHSAVVSSQTVLRAHFIRASGQMNGARDYANYETMVGNRHSSETYDAARCRSIASYARLAAGASDEDLGELARVASGPLPVSCPTTTPASLARTPIPANEAEATAATRRLIAGQGTGPSNPLAYDENAPDAAAWETVPTEAAGEIAAQESAMPKPPPVIAAAAAQPATPAPGAADPSEALAAAAKALAAAAEAMKTQPKVPVGGP